ncbi:TetR family transcriptional regulator [Paenibacillus terreus]|uniref:TetR family transcriptional regulator n=1 Tax=Paenibacillus terreus TaxID=1387834 RepID=UPI0035CCE5F8
MTTSTVHDKYNAILQAAIEIISEKGLHSTSISDIVKRAGVAQGTFYLYFRSKNALIPAIAQSLISVTMEKVRDKTKDRKDFPEFLQILIEEIYNITDEYKDVIVLVYSGLAIDHSMEMWETIYKPYYEWFEAEIKRAMDNKEVIAELNIPWTSKLVINLVENAAERFFIGRDQDITREQSQTEVFQFLKRSMLLER